jgi:hypothetical protein
MRMYRRGQPRANRHDVLISKGAIHLMRVVSKMLRELARAPVGFAIVIWHPNDKDAERPGGVHLFASGDEAQIIEALGTSHEHLTTGAYLLPFEHRL